MTRVQIRLEPEGLGRVDVSIRIGSDGGLSAKLDFDNPHAGEAVKAQAGELRAALEQAGFSLDRSDLSFTTGGSGQHSSGGQGRPASANFVVGRSSLEQPAATASVARSRAAVSAPDGLDIRV